MPDFSVDPNEFKLARQWLQDQRNRGEKIEFPVKIRRTQKRKNGLQEGDIDTEHSFIVFEDPQSPDGIKLAAIARDEEGGLGGGHYGKTKLIQWENGKIDVLKISRTETMEKDPNGFKKGKIKVKHEIDSATVLDLHKHYYGADYDFNTRLLREERKKEYYILPYISGKNLFDLIGNHSTEIPLVLKLQIALACVQEAKRIEDLDARHNDLLPHNFMVVFEQNPGDAIYPYKPTVKLIDFDEAQRKNSSNANNDISFLKNKVFPFLLPEWMMKDIGKINNLNQMESYLKTRIKFNRLSVARAIYNKLHPFKPSHNFLPKKPR